MLKKFLSPLAIICFLFVSNAQAAMTYSSQFGTSWSGNGQLNSPSDITTDSSGNIYVVDSGNNRIQKFNSSGVYQSQFGSFGSGDGQFNGPGSIAIDSSGNIYVTDRANNRIQKFNASGVYQSQFGSSGTGDGQFSTPYGIAIDTSGNIYVVDNGNYRVQKFNSSGVYQSQFESDGAGDGQFQSPEGIALDSSGNIYLADTGNNRIEKFNSSGVYQSQFGSNGTGDGQFQSPIALTIDSSGNIYVTDSANYRIQKFNSSGVYQSQFGSSGTGDGQFDGANSPAGIALDSSGNIYVVDTGNSRVQKLIDDITAPSAPTITAPSTNAKIITSTSTATGTCETGATVSIANANLATDPTTTTCSSSAFSVSISWVEIGINPPQILTFTQTDAAGNVSASATVSVDRAAQTGSGGGYSAPLPEGPSTPNESTTPETPVSTTVTETPIQTPVEPTSTEIPVITAPITPTEIPVNSSFGSTSEQPTSVLSLNINISPRRNTSADVIKLQQFFNTYEGETLGLTGIYDGDTEEAVKRFQVKYASEILRPLRLRNPTGNVGIFTRNKINSMIARDSLEPAPLHTNITPQRNNSPVDVIKLQQFFNTHEGESLTLTGIYDLATQGAVKRFQVKYAQEILRPLGLKNPTNNVGIFMRAKINGMIGE